MSFLSWFYPKEPRNRRASDRTPPVGVVSKCPNCGHDVLLVFVATGDRVKAVESAKMASPGLKHEANGAIPDATHTETVLAERKAALEKKPRRRIYDNDLRNPSE